MRVLRGTVTGWTAPSVGDRRWSRNRPRPVLKERLFTRDGREHDIDRKVVLNIFPCFVPEARKGDQILLICSPNFQLNCLRYAPTGWLGGSSRDRPNSFPRKVPGRYSRL